MELSTKKSAIELICPAIESGIRERSLEVPILPRIVTEVLALVEDPDSNMGQLAKLIEADPTLAAHVMRVANSPAFAGSVKMSSLQQASARLGMDNIAQMALAISMGPTLFATPGYEQLINDIWRSSLAQALWAKEVARLRRQNVEVAYLSGMLAQIGKPAVLGAALSEADRLKLALTSDDVEQVIENYHPSVAALLTDLWHLPLVSSCIASLYGLSSLGSVTELAESVVENVIAAKSFAVVTLEESEIDLEALVTNPAIVDLALYPEDVDQLLAKSPMIKASVDALMI